MTLQTYSILYLNLVSEMIYVVAERLKTQKIPIDKSKLGTYLSIINLKLVKQNNFINYTYIYFLFFQHIK